PVMACSLPDRTRRRRELGRGGHGLMRRLRERRTSKLPALAGAARESRMPNPIAAIRRRSRRCCCQVTCDVYSLTARIATAGTWPDSSSDRELRLALLRIAPWLGWAAIAAVL